MRRILLVLTVALVMVAMVAVMALPAFAQVVTGSNPQGLGKDRAESNCSEHVGGDFYTVNRGSKGFVNHGCESPGQEKK
jgi:hypothetical protein